MLPFDLSEETSEPRRQARLFLQEFLMQERPVEFTKLDVTPNLCPNCGAPCDNDKSPYCDEQCREEAAFVRQLRRALAEDALSDADRQVAFGQTLWHVLGGGYPVRTALVPPKAVQRVLDRDGGKCQVCEGPATTVDHARTACNRPVNLRAVCANCNLDRPFGDPEITARPHCGPRYARLTMRVFSPEPLALCDSSEDWDWRGFLRMRR